MEKLKLTTTPRKILGRKVKQLRREGLIPANIYGKKIKSISISIDAKEFEKLFKSAGETSLIELTIGKDKKAVLIRNVQKEPVDESVLHVDFQEVDLKEKVTANVPVEFVGESSLEKQSLGTIVQHLDEIEVKALPADLPEKFEVDISILEEVDQTIFVKDLKYDKSKVEISDEDLEKIIAKAEPPAKEEEVAPAPEVEAGVPPEGAPTAEGAAEGDKGTETPKAEVNTEPSK